ncbi:MAG: hypothetical protein LVR00_07190 [Rhabdochlamydiaceae bacterium]
MSYVQKLQPYLGCATFLGISGLSAYRVFQAKIPVEKAVSIGVFTHQVLSGLNWLPESLKFKGLIESLQKLAGQQKSIRSVFLVVQSTRELFTF